MNSAPAATLVIMFSLKGLVMGMYLKNKIKRTFSDSSLADDALSLPELKNVTLDVVTGFFLMCEFRGWLLKSFMNGGGVGQELAGSAGSDLLADALVTLAEGEQADTSCWADWGQRGLLFFGV